MNKEKEPVIGKVEEGVFLRLHVAEGDVEIDGKEVKFELAVTYSYTPLVLVGKKAFILSWEDIVNLAEEAGLFSEVGE